VTSRRDSMSLIILLALLFFAVPVIELCAQDSSVPVVVSAVVEREVSTGQTFVGTVIPVKTSLVGSAVDGRVMTFFVNEGDFVKKNAPLATLRTDTIKIELSAAKAELKLRAEELAELKNGSRPEEIAQSEARLAAAKSSRDYSKKKYERLESLFRENQAVSEDEKQEARSVADRDEQSYLEAKAFYDLTVKGPRKERISQAKARELVQSEQVRLIEDKITKYTIRAPFDGYISAEHTEVGQWVDQGDSIAEIVLLSEIDIRVYVLAEHVAHLQPGMSARIDVPALPKDIFTGKVVLIVPKADVRSRSFPVKIRVQNQQDKGGPLLKSGMLARVALPTGEKKQMLLVSKDALVLGEAKPKVFVVDRDPQQANQGVVRAVAVELGVADGGMIQVQGLHKEKDQLVVVRGNERLRPGQKVSMRRIQTKEPSQVGK
jgi:HlyD family secretion protein